MRCCHASCGNTDCAADCMRVSKSDDLVTIRLCWVKDQGAMPSTALLLVSKDPYPNIIEVWRL
jgi:hypothetical protein